MYLYSGDLGFNDSIQVLLPHPLEFSVDVMRRFHNCSTDLTSENIIASVHTFYASDSEWVHWYLYTWLCVTSIILALYYNFGLLDIYVVCRTGSSVHPVRVEVVFTREPIFLK